MRWYWIEACAVHPTDSDAAFAVGRGGQLFRATDREQSWAPQSIASLAFGTPVDLVIAPVTSDGTRPGKDDVALDSAD